MENSDRELGYGIGVICPVCEKFVIEEEYDMCEICGWFLSLYDYDNRDKCSGTNPFSVLVYKEKWKNNELPPLIHFGKDGQQLSEEEFKKTLYTDDMGFYHQKL